MENQKNESLSLKVTQEPIIQYNAIETISQQVISRIKELDLENIEVTEDNFKEIKKLKASLKSEFNVFEDQRGYIRDMVEKPYKDFKKKYDEGIKHVYEKAETLLKDKIDKVSNELLKKYIDVFKKYFDEKNKYEFITFEDANIHITSSKKENLIKKEIDDYLAKIEEDVNTISTLENRERIIAKYQLSKDLNSAISQVAQEVKIEEDNKAKEVEREVKGLEKNKEDVGSTHNVAKAQHAEPNLFTQSVSNKMNVELSEQVSATFKVVGTINQLKSLKNFMESEGIKYE